MPKDNIVAKQLKEQRLIKAASKSHGNYSSGYISICALGNGGYGVPSCIYVIADDSRYMFNCGEGVQRLAMEHKMKVSRVEHVFVTSPRWENLGGIPGLALTVQGIGVTRLTVHGHQEIAELFDITKPFMHMNLLNIKMYEGAEFQDRSMKVKYVALEKSRSGSTPDKRAQLGDPDSMRVNTVLAYICKLFPKPGQLLLSKCVELGVPPGPLFGKLKSGYEITLPNGTVVKPSDVVSPEEPGPVFVILEVPSEEYVDSLLTAEEFKAHQIHDGVKEEDIPYCIVHSTPKAVYETSKYQEFLSKFPASTIHWQLNSENCNESSAASFRAQCRLNLISDEVFPLLPRCSSKGLLPLSKLSLRPKKGFDEKAPLDIDPAHYIEEAHQSPNFAGLYSKLQETLATVDCTDQREYPEITFLGTGSSIPSKDRNVSAILLKTSPNMYIMLDCGEGSWGQLVRHYGHEKAVEIVRNLKFVYISHLHADHHLGLIGIIKRRMELGCPKLNVLAPGFLTPWLLKYNDLYEAIQYEHLQCVNFLHDRELANGSETFAELGVDKISTCYVVHCRDAYGIRVESNGYSVVYSGDTRPCSNLVKLGMNCDLLIHEATMEDTFADDALLKMHSTTSQAIAIGEQMNTKFTLLTHFSQRYAKLPVVEDSVFAEGKVACAFDHMRVSPRNLSVLPHFYEILKSLFSEQVEVMQTKTEKFLERKEREEIEKNEEKDKHEETNVEEKKI